MFSNGESQLDLCMFSGVQMPLLVAQSTVTANAEGAEGVYKRYSRSCTGATAAATEWRPTDLLLWLVRYSEANNSLMVIKKVTMTIL